MVTDDKVIQETRASAAFVMVLFSWSIAVSAPEGLILDFKVEVAQPFMVIYFKYCGAFAFLLLVSAIIFLVWILVSLYLKL